MLLNTDLHGHVSYHCRGSPSDLITLKLSAQGRVKTVPHEQETWDPGPIRAGHS